MGLELVHTTTDILGATLGHRDWLCTRLQDDWEPILNQTMIGLFLGQHLLHK